MPVAEPLAQVRVRTTTVPRPVTRPVSRPDGAASSDSSSSFSNRLLVVTIIGLCLWVGYKVATGNYYTPRSNFGFYLGVVGSTMMLLMLAYPLRKHVSFMQRWGALKNWFRLHMIMGIVGPTLVLFHSTFHLRSANATIALFSMLGVVISGIIGRFVYTKIHYGLYGRRATLGKVREELAGLSSEAKSRLHFAPRVEQWLQSFERDSMQLDRTFTSHLFSPLTIGLKRIILTFRCKRELRKVLRTERHPDIRGGAPEVIQLASSYLRECERVAQFSTYERLFSLWHVLHIPLIYVLAACTIFHIIAAYMY
jgi:hypothetical protein